MSTRPKVFKAIITALLAAVVFTLSYAITYLVGGIINDLLIKVPLIGKLISWLFRIRGDSPGMVLTLLSSGVAYYVTMAAQEAINKDARTRGLSCVLHGAGIVLFQIVFLFINLIYGDAILANVIQLIAGFIIFSGGMGELKEN